MALFPRTVSTLLAVALLAPAAAVAADEGAAAAAPAADKPAPVFLAPPALDRPFAKMAEPLRAVLAARLVATGKYVEVASSATEKAVDEAVRQVNRDSTDEQSMVQIGKGVGARLLVTAEVRGDAAGCLVTVRLTELESRISPRIHVQQLPRCTQKELFQEMGSAAAVLAGADAAAAAREATPPPPPGGPAGTLIIEAKPANLVKISVTDPAGQTSEASSPYRNDQAAAGTWQIVLSAKGHAPQTRSVTVNPSETALVKLELPLLATITVTGSPAGALARLAGPGAFTAEGQLPWTAQGLPPGPYELTVSAEGAETQTRSVRVEPGGTAQVDVQLGPAPPAKDAPPPPCPRGQERSEATLGQCCWPGQAWARTRCVGIPASCPEGLVADEATQACKLSGCLDGQERVDGVHCCWPGQTWVAERAQCVGVPSRCPDEHEAHGDECVPLVLDAATRPRLLEVDVAASPDWGGMVGGRVELLSWRTPSLLFTAAFAGAYLDLAPGSTSQPANTPPGSNGPARSFTLDCTVSFDAGLAQVGWKKTLTAHHELGAALAPLSFGLYRHMTQKGDAFYDEVRGKWLRFPYTTTDRYLSFALASVYYRLLLSGLDLNVRLQSPLVWYRQQERCSDEGAIGEVCEMLSEKLWDGRPPLFVQVGVGF